MMGGPKKKERRQQPQGKEGQEKPSGGQEKGLFFESPMHFEQLFFLRGIIKKTI